MKLAIVVPCYNEEAVLPETTLRLSNILTSLKADGQIDEGVLLYVDDGSKDRTWELISQFATENPMVLGLKLSHNQGHQYALWAGLEWASGNADAAVSIDADLQDDTNVIPEMVAEFNHGCDIVYGVRKGRKTDTVFKRSTALMFYKLMNALGGKIIYNHADFRLMSRRALKALMQFGERNLFLRGMVASLGFPSAIVYYNRKERFAGESKYPFSKMLAFALDGITSFSTKPLRYIMYFGIAFVLIAFAVIVYALISYFDGNAIQGWTSLLISVWLIGGVVLIACGIIGEYIGKIYIEAKHRPRYFVEEDTSLKGKGMNMGDNKK